MAGQLDLTAANFDLTAAQSSADMTAGLAMQLTRIGQSNAPHEVAYTKVQNRPYTSFDEIFAASAGVVSAKAFDNTDGTGSLTLSGANVTYTDSGSAQSVTVGGTAFSIKPHAVETVNATGANDSFVFQKGFGQDTINGFSTTGGDTLQLQKSMFSYIDPFASQSVDLAAVLSHASSGVSSVTIVGDTAGDHLTLNGFTAVTLAAAQITFV